jgi:HAD superfamily hydrolase (TIGR01450 family)
MIRIPTITIDELIARHDALLLDAYGVLVHRDGPLPGAVELIGALNRLAKPYFLLTNTAARLPEHAAERYRGFGLAFEPGQIITSGSLIAPYFAARDLVDRRCAVLGPQDSFHYVERAGGRPVQPHEDFEVLLIGDQVGFPFLESVDAVLSRLIEKLDRGETVPMILPNPDLIYPKSSGFGITSGAVALIIEAALKQRYPDRPDLSFVRLGKPEPGLFEAAVRRAGTRNLVMIGDQIETDIRGANGFGIGSALVAGGVAGFTIPETGPQPTWLLASIAPKGFTRR